MLIYILVFVRQEVFRFLAQSGEDLAFGKTRCQTIKATAQQFVEKNNMVKMMFIVGQVCTVLNGWTSETSKF